MKRAISILKLAVLLILAVLCFSEFVRAIMIIVNPDGIPVFMNERFLFRFSYVLTLIFIVLELFNKRMTGKGSFGSVTVPVIKTSIATLLIVSRWIKAVCIKNPEGLLYKFANAGDKFFDFSYFIFTVIFIAFVIYTVFKTDVKGKN